MLSISIVTYNTSTDELRKCLSSLASPIVKTIYIVDNSNQQYLSDFCKEYDNVVYIGGENVGYGAGHNKALRKALEDKELKYHLVLNSDVYFEPSILEKIANFMDSNDDVAQIQPYVTFPNGELQYTVRLLPTPANLIFRRFMPKSMVKKMDNCYTLAFWNHKTIANIAYHQGSFMFFRLSAFEKVGLFDERYFMYPEDIDITRRMHQHFKTLYWPEVSIVHAHRAESYKSKKMLKIHIVNMIKYFNKWGWIFDSERKQVNKEILDALGYNNKTNS